MQKGSKQMMMIRRDLTSKEIWSYYWKEQSKKNKKNQRKQLTNKIKQFIINNVKRVKQVIKQKIKKIKKNVDKPFQLCYNKYVKKTKNNF